LLFFYYKLKRQLRKECIKKYIDRFGAFMNFKPYYLLPALLAALASGCSSSCAKGDTGPVGPSGSNGSNGQNAYPIATTYLYNNNFDSAANVNEWVGYVNAGGTVTASLISSLYLSAPKCLGLNMAGGAGSNVAMSLNYTGIGNLVFDNYQNFSGFTSNNQQDEWTFYFGGKRHMTVGAILSGGALNLYSYNGATQVTVFTNLNQTNWHHLTEVWHQGADTSDYYVDGNLVAQGYASNALVWSTAASTYELACYIPSSAIASGETRYFDNLSVGQ
jgi:hypothetical protein